MLSRVFANLSLNRYADHSAAQPAHLSSPGSTTASSSIPLKQDPLWEDPALVKREAVAEQGSLSHIRNALCMSAADPHWPGQAFRDAPSAPEVSEREKSLTGVVIWPHQVDEPLETIEKQQGAYGRHIRSGIEEGGEKIRQGEITCFRELWNHAVQVRVNAPSKLFIYWEKDQNPLEVRCTPALGPNLRTTLGKKCDFVRTRAMEHPLYRRDYFEGKYVAPSLEISGKNASLTTVGELVIQGSLPTSKGRHETVTMTSFVHKDVLNGTGSNTTLDVKEREFVHPKFTDLPKVGRHVGRLYREAMDAPDDAVFKEKAARLYWWTAHSCFDLRGSAAKLEVAYRSMYQARGLHCPLWRPGVSADIEAILSTEDEWLGRYEQLMQTSPTNGAASATSASTSRAPTVRL
ncbi:MAG TPA: hypothetical protein VFS42_01270 [Burkholderiaceae bacterium]|nr:hypothetical protein [Burkholderiaceae bacterium]